MRNGRLAQLAVALYLFLRDVCGGDFIGWIDDHLSQSRSKEPNADPIIDAMWHIHGVSDKVLSLALVVLLLGGRPGDSLWQAAGAELIVIDRLVHNWLHRSGICALSTPGTDMAQSATHPMAAPTSCGEPSHESTPVATVSKTLRRSLA